MQAHTFSNPEEKFPNVNITTTNIAIKGIENFKKIR
jgi:hypothetical protein